MPDNRRTWTEEDIAKLKEMAGKLALQEIAKELGRTPGATKGFEPNSPIWVSAPI